MSNKFPTGLKVFITLSVFKNTIPALIFSLLTVIGVPISDKFSYFLSSLSLSVGKILQNELTYNSSNSLVTMSLFTSFIVCIVWVLIITNSLTFEKFRKKSFLKVIRGLAVLNVILLVMKMISGTAGYSTGEWNSGINFLTSLALTISFCVYVFVSKSFKNFFYEETSKVSPS